LPITSTQFAMEGEVEGKIRPGKTASGEKLPKSLDGVRNDSGPASPDHDAKARNHGISVLVSPPEEEVPTQTEVNAASQTKPHSSESASLPDAQRDKVEGDIHHAHHGSQSGLGQRAASNTAPQHSGGSVLPSNSALSAHSDEGHWDSIFPESILCRLKLYLRDKRPLDKAPQSNHLSTLGPKNLRWHEKTTYDSDEWLISNSQKGHELHQTLRDNAARESYIRYGICRVIGSKHEACEELEDPDQLEEKAISLICGFIRDHMYEHFQLEIIWEYATVLIEKLPNEKYAETIASEISIKIVQNYVQKSYLPRKDLVRIMRWEVIERIIQEDKSLKEYNWTAEERTKFAMKVQQESSRLQAVCIYQGLPMKFLKHLMDHDIRDIDPPDEGFEDRHRRECVERNCETYMNKFFDMYYGFFAHKFDPDGVMQTFNENVVLPLYYVCNKRKSQLGFGAASTVYAVRIDPVHHSLSHVGHQVGLQ
jgi:hypothetical protein